MRRRRLPKGSRVSKKRKTNPMILGKGRLDKSEYEHSNISDTILENMKKVITKPSDVFKYVTSYGPGGRRDFTPGLEERAHGTGDQNKSNEFSHSPGILELRNNTKMRGK